MVIALFAVIILTKNCCSTPRHSLHTLFHPSVHHPLNHSLILHPHAPAHSFIHSTTSLLTNGQLIYSFDGPLTLLPITHRTIRSLRKKTLCNRDTFCKDEATNQLLVVPAQHLHIQTRAPTHSRSLSHTCTHLHRQRKKQNQTNTGLLVSAPPTH